jgi:hypothetical protein
MLPHSGHGAERRSAFGSGDIALRTGRGGFCGERLVHCIRIALHLRGKLAPLPGRAERRLEIAAPFADEDSARRKFGILFESPRDCTDESLP